MSSSRDLLSEYRKSVHNVVSSQSFGNQFCKLSRQGNRRGMIEILMELPEVNNLIIEKNYHYKNDKLAENLYKDIVSPKNEVDENQKAIILTKSVFAATCNNDYYEEFRIESFLIKSESYKKMNLKENSKFCLNEAMKSVNDFIQKKFGNEKEDVFKKEKVCFLKPIFERLNLMRKSIEDNHVAENLNNSLKDLKIPSVKGKPNEKLKACSDAIAVGYNEAKGRFLYATRRIKTGSVLIVDQPFTFSTDQEAFERNCLNCHISLKLEHTISIPCNNCQTVSFCSETCRKESWEKYHKYECNIFNYFYNFETQEKHQRSHLLLAYRTTISKSLNKSNSLDSEFINYHSLDSEPEEASPKIASEEYNPLDYKTVYSLETHCAQTDPKENLRFALNSIFLARLLQFVLKDISPDISIDQREIILLAVGTFRHMQAINCNAYEIVENIRNEESKVCEPRNIGGAIYTSVSLSNHSCYPNVVRHSYPGGIVVVTALRPIEKGHEILDCYGPHFLKEEKHIRRESLQKKYHFLCSCEACTFDWKMPLSDNDIFKCSCSNFKISESQKFSKCDQCGDKIDLKKIRRRLEESKKQRLNAISKIYDGKYAEALPILLEHSNYVEKILAEPNLGAIKTQQSIIQCLNSMACTSV
ncbi:SET and MYND domain-containing protein 4-like isoform X2 [Belonocnema kinseyi]|uniref:SET and MYND domain-containing protein 4-like isoform X2 n=1 Tax=Belonocnema kinseyi TaxID=2817044 RepID=UPI00143CF0B9|nr:SET and MYND domain-containing protein 4-like isoform X2 [Belonocnema kinseyi]